MSRRRLQHGIPGGFVLGRLGQGYGKPGLIAISPGAGIKANPGNPSGGGGGSSKPANIQTLLNAIGSTQGDVLYRGSALWSALAPGTAGYFLQTAGAGADPVWAAVNIQTLLDSIGSTRGDILYRGASGWAVLAPGTAGQVLLTGGSGADPYWGSPTSYSNGGGTGDRTGSITVTDNNVLDGSGADNNLVDGAFGTNSTDSCAFRSLYSKGFILWDFGSGAKKIIDEIKWYQSTTDTHGTDWYVIASSNGSDFVVLSGTFVLGGATPYQTISLSNSNGYRYYALINRDHLTDNTINTSSTPWLEEAEFRITDAAAQAAVDNTVASYYLKGGFGARTSAITVTTTASMGGGTAITALVDGKAFPQTGAESSTQSCFFTGGESSKEIKFDFGASYSPKITEATWFQSTSDTHGTWKWAGSTNDISYTDLITGITLGGAKQQTHAVASSVAYRYYKLIQTAGTTNSTPWLREIEFKLHV